LSAFATGDHPADDVAAEDIEHDVKVEVSPLGWAKQLGDVPAPELVGGRGEQRRATGTWCATNNDRVLRRAMRRRLALANDPGSARCEDAQGPFRVHWG